jgi:hypothetical protein
MIVSNGKIASTHQANIPNNRVPPKDALLYVVDSMENTNNINPTMKFPPKDVQLQGANPTNQYTT